ncbi:hypothetical protein, partial [Paraburkholderia fungorum]
MKASDLFMHLLKYEYLGKVETTEAQTSSALWQVSTVLVQPPPGEYGTQRLHFRATPLPMQTIRRMTASWEAFILTPSEDLITVKDLLLVFS